MKHTKGERISTVGMFGYKFEFYDNENPEKSIEMMHHTFKSFLEHYDNDMKGQDY